MNRILKRLAVGLVGLSGIILSQSYAQAEPRIVGAIFCDTRSQITDVFHRLEFREQKADDAMKAINGKQTPVYCFRSPVPIVLDKFKLEESKIRRLGRTAYVYSGRAIGYVANGKYFAFEKMSRHYFVAYEPMEKKHEVTML